MRVALTLLLVGAHFIVALITPTCSLLPIIIGSKSSPSAQAFSVFPAADSNNTMQGFASFGSGFMLEDSTTTCTFDDFLPVSGPINLNQGRLTLQQDFTLANAMTWLGGGRIEGNNHAIELPSQVATLQLPYTTNRTFKAIANVPLEIDVLSDIRSIDWKPGDAYLATGQRAILGTELKLLYFSGSTVTITAQLNLAREVTTVRWHPTQSFVAVGLASGAGDDLEIYRHTVSNGSFVKTDGAGLSAAGSAVAWHPSGNYLVVGGDNDSNELQIFPFTAGSVGSPTNINVSSNQDVNREAISFSPGGNQLAVGFTNNTGTNISEVHIYNFTATSLTLSTSLDAGNNVQIVDWSPTGSYIAAGLTGGTNNIRIYNTATPSGALREVLTARLNETRDVYAVHWHPSGDYVAFGVNTGLSNELRIFYFDKPNGVLSEILGIQSLDEIWAARWSNDGNYIAYGFETNLLTNRVDIAGFASADSPIFLDTATLICNSNVDFLSSLYIKGICKINGQGKQIRFLQGSQLLVRPNSELILENIEVSGIKNNLRCMNNSGKILLRNCELSFDRDFTFSHGSFYCDQDAVFTGTSVFNYTTVLASTIGSMGTLTVNPGMTFRYAPLSNKNNLLSMESATSRLFLDGCSLYSTSTGIKLSTGILAIDNSVTLSSAATIPANSIKLSSNLDIQILGGAVLDLYGYITYE